MHFDPTQLLADNIRREMVRALLNGKPMKSRLTGGQKTAADELADFITYEIDAAQSYLAAVLRGETVTPEIVQAYADYFAKIEMIDYDEDEAAESALADTQCDRERELGWQL